MKYEEYMKKWKEWQKQHKTAPDEAYLKQWKEWEKKHRRIRND